MTAAIVRDWPYARLVAHRGAGKLAPENTLTAMRVGHAHGYRMVEFDVKLSAANLSFLLHDATLERTTSGRGRADALPWRELSSARCGRMAFGEIRRPSRCRPSPRSPRWARAHGVACICGDQAHAGTRMRDRPPVALDAATL
jgi:glycerophosphoryl diester phosphodiesterase